MALYKVSTHLHYGLSTGPSDQAIITHWFVAPLAGPTVLAEAMTRVGDFWNADTGPSTKRVGSFISQMVNRENVILRGVEVNAVTGLEMGEATLFEFDDFPAPGVGSELPAEVAICVSYEAGGHGGPIRRRRGRFYFGPLDSTSLAATAGEDARVDDNVMAALVAGTDVLLAFGSENTAWCVYSRADGQAKEITNGWIDDAFDIQRSRGTGAGSRVLFGP